MNKCENIKYTVCYIVHRGRTLYRNSKVACEYSAENMKPCCQDSGQEKIITRPTTSSREQSKCANFIRIAENMKPFCQDSRQEKIITRPTTSSREQSKCANFIRIRLVYRGTHLQIISSLSNPLNTGFDQFFLNHARALNTLSVKKSLTN